MLVEDALVIVGEELALVEASASWLDAEEAGPGKRAVNLGISPVEA